MKILSIDADAKTVKGLKKGYRTAISYLAPSNASGVMNTCPSASKGCRAACLYGAGRAKFTPSIPKARINKTKFFHYIDRSKSQTPAQRGRKTSIIAISNYMQVLGIRKYFM